MAPTSAAPAKRKAFSSDKEAEPYRPKKFKTADGPKRQKFDDENASSRPKQAGKPFEGGLCPAPNS